MKRIIELCRPTLGENSLQKKWKMHLLLNCRSTYKLKTIYNEEVEGTNKSNYSHSITGHLPTNGFVVQNI